MRNVVWGRRAIGVMGAAAAVWVMAVAAQISGTAHASPDPVRLPLRLADTGAFDPRNRLFAPQYPLWSDGLTKRRWLQLPAGAAIDGTDETSWTFPVGTRLWKEFSLGGRRVETRMLWKASEAAWIAATYAWNPEGTDAVLAPEGGIARVIEVAPGRRHGIPSRTDCLACHGTTPVPLGFTALQLSPDRDPNAIHGEPLPAGALTLQTLVDERLLRGARADLLANPPGIRTADAATRAVLGYLATNCGVCHNGRGEIAALGPTIRLRDLLADGDAVARSLVAQPTRWQVPSAPDGAGALVHPGRPDLSAIVVRMRSRSPSSQMPPLGTVVRDEEAVDAVTKWVTNLPTRPH